MMILVPRTVSHIGRERMAKAAAEDRRADKADLGNQLRRRARAAHVALVQVNEVAARDWHRDNDPIPSPKAFGGIPMHPTRVRALAKILADLGWSDDAKAPCELVPTLEEVLATAAADARRELADTEHALLEYEAEQRGFPSVKEYQADMRRRALEAEQLHAERAALQEEEDRKAGRL